MSTKTHRRLRILDLRKKELRLKDTVKTQCQLNMLKVVVIKILKDMNISDKKIKDIKIKPGTDHEMRNNSALIIYTKEKDIILIRRNLKVSDVLVEIAHEIGHKITIFGKFGFTRNRRNIIGEISAYNFSELFLKVFCKIKNCEIRTVDMSLKYGIRHSFVHYISQKLKFVPLGKLIKNEYKITG